MKCRFPLCLLLLLPTACAVAPAQSPQQAACLQRMNTHVVELLPGFAALGYRPAVHLQLDDEMRNGRGFRQRDGVLGDALPGGRIRLRAESVCGSEFVARAVVAHEMAHVALKHIGMPGNGITLEWEKPPQQEVEADRLALDVLRRTGGHPRAERFIECHLTGCDALSPAVPRRAPLPRAGAERSPAAP